MKPLKFVLILFLYAAFSKVPLTCRAQPVVVQGIGPLTFLLAPKDLTVIGALYVNLSSNLSPSQGMAVDGRINIQTYSVPVIRTFAIKKNFAQVFVGTNYGHMKGEFNMAGQSFDVGRSGFLDGTILFRVGLKNAPALNLPGFMQRDLNLQVYALAALSVPVGRYDQNRRINLGANRWAFRFGLPVVVPLSGSRDKPVTWEMIPNIIIYTRNNKPFEGNVKKQKPLWYLEQHLSKYFTPKLWSSIDIGYQYGGKISVDGVEGRKINQLGAGVSLGYTLIASLVIQATYGRVWFARTNGRLIRVGATLAVPSKRDREEVRKKRRQTQSE